MPVFGKRRSPKVSIFYVTDIHGSDVCFRKFLAAKDAYDVDHLIMGGDMTGKMIVPIVRTAKGLRIDFGGQQVRADENEVESVEQRIQNAGFYPLLVQEEDLDRYRDPKLVDEEFLRQMTRTLERWNEFALRKGFGRDSILVAAGNDDPFGIDPVLEELPVFRWVEGGSVDLSNGGASYVMVSCGYSNRTPWETPREMDEGELERYLLELLEGVDPERCILNAHVPPFDSGLDTGPDIDPHSTPQDVRQRKGGVGGPMTKPVGSVAVRRVIEEVQPLLSLHGHIHESRGSVRIGRTVCINPGSDYGESVLRGALVRLDEQGIVTHQLTSG